jgi:hypothetical protein
MQFQASAELEKQPTAGMLNDLYAFDPVKLTWVDISATAVGTAPERRSAPGLAAVGQRLYIHAGFSESCT